MTVITGIDVQSIDEVNDSLASFGDRYCKRLYSDRELEECGANRELLAGSLAIRFAAKEAVIKALRPLDHIPSWRSIEVLLRPRGGPEIVLSGESATLATELGVSTIFLSVSLARDYAIAAVVVDVPRESANSQPYGASAVSPG